MQQRAQNNLVEVICETYTVSSFYHRANERIVHMMMSWQWNAFRITGSLWGESTGDRGIPLTKGKQFRPLVEQCVAQTVGLSVIWDTLI